MMSVPSEKQATGGSRNNSGSILSDFEIVDKAELKASSLYPDISNEQSELKIPSLYPDISNEESGADAEAKAIANTKPTEMAVSGKGNVRIVTPPDGSLHQDGVSRKEPQIDGQQVLWDLAYYTNPVRSLVVLAKLLAVWALLTFDFGFTVMAIAAWLVLHITVFLFMLAAVKFAIDKFYHKIVDPISFPRQILQPQVAVAAEFLRPVILSEDAAILCVKSLYATLPAVQNNILDVLYCTSFKKTAKVIVAAKIIWSVAWVSIPTLVFASIVGFFTIPIGYRKYQSEIDQILNIIVGHMRQVAKKVPAPIRQLLGLCDDKSKTS